VKLSIEISVFRCNVSRDIKQRIIRFARLWTLDLGDSFSLAWV